MLNKFLCSLLVLIPVMSHAGNAPGKDSDWEKVYSGTPFDVYVNQGSIDTSNGVSTGGLFLLSDKTTNSNIYKVMQVTKPECTKKSGALIINTASGIMTNYAPFSFPPLTLFDSMAEYLCKHG